MANKWGRERCPSRLKDKGWGTALRRREEEEAAEWRQEGRVAFLGTTVPDVGATRETGDWLKERLSALV